MVRLLPQHKLLGLAIIEHTSVQVFSNFHAVLMFD